MKKLALAFVALALTGLVAFAEDAAPVTSIHGSLISGVKATLGSTPTFQLYDNNDGVAGYYGTLSFASSGANYGVNLGLKTTNGTLGDNGSWAWVSPLAGLKISAGSGNDNPFGQVDNTGDGSFSTAGVAATYAFSPLTVGVTLNPVATAGTALPYHVGAALALDKLANVKAELGGDLTGTALKDARFSANFVAVSGLTASAGYYLTTTTTALDTSVYDALLGYSYSAGDLTAGATALLTNTSFYIDPTVSYTVAKGLSVGAGYTYYLNGGTNDFNLNSTLSVAPSYTLVLNLDYTTDLSFDADFRYSF